MSLKVLLLHFIIIRALDALPNLLGPLLEGIGKSLKMHVSVFIGGPEPRQKGKINAITLVYSSNKVYYGTDEPLASITAITRLLLPKSGPWRTLRNSPSSRMLSLIF